MTTDDISLVAAVISACAIGITVWQGFQSRHHNRLTVRPLLTWRESRSANDDGFQVAYTVTNHGVGPAIVLERFITVDGAKFSPPDGDVIEQAVRQVFANRVHWVLRQHTLPAVGAAIPIGGEVVVASITFPGMRPETFKAMLKLSPPAGLVLHYESLYKERHTLKV